MQNSDLFTIEADSHPVVNGYHDPILLIVTAYASLYRVTKSGRYFLIKTTKDNSPQARAMLRREYKLSIGCDHPHLVHVYLFEEDSPVGPGIVMEYIEGRTLDHFLAENPTPTVRRRIFEELLSVVDYLHKRGIVHNDLKPENILITRSGDRLKLIDFGLSDSDAQLLRTPGCTPAYASPELLSGALQPDLRSDIYSIGRLMQLIFAGKHHGIIRRCLQPDRERRFENVERLRQRWRRRNRPWHLLLATIGAILFLLPSLLYLHERQTRMEFLREESQRIEQNDSIYRHLEQARARYEFLADSIETRLAVDARRQAQRDSVMHYFERKIEANYRELKDSIETCSYSDMACVYLCELNYRWWHLYEELNRLNLDPELCDQIRARIDRLSGDYSTQLYKIVDRKPSFPRDSLPWEETSRILNRISERIRQFQ